MLSLTNQSYAERARFLAAKLAARDARTEVLSAIDQLVRDRKDGSAEVPRERRFVS